MSDLIKALQIFLKYGDKEWPTACGHDVFYVSIDPNIVSEEDKEQLKELSFLPEDEGFISFRFGNC